MPKTKRFPASLLALSLCAGTAWCAPATQPKAAPKPAALAAPAPKLTETAHYGVYMLGSRIGSMVTKTYDGSFEGKPAQRADAEMNISVAALGSTIEQKMNVTEWLDKAGRPLIGKIRMTSAGRTTQIDTRYSPDKVVCNLDAAGQKSTKIVPIPKGVTLTVDPQMAGLGNGDDLKVGQKLTLHFFEPVTMTIQKVETEVVKSENKTVGGKQVPAFLVQTTNSFTGKSETWVDKKGGLLEDNNPLGLRIVREDYESDVAKTYTPPQDFAVATSVKTAVKIADARKTSYLKLKISGIPDAALILTDARQRVPEQSPAAPISATYEVRARELPVRALPLALPTARIPGLGDAAYLGISDPTIQKQAKELAAGAADRAALAKTIRAWVKGHMEKPSNIGTPRNSAEIMKSKEGVCRDYATLFAALARAAGLPTRICSGIVFFQDGFFYHAWDECQLTDGPDGWYAFDSTLGDDFVDATHIKFAQGDPIEMFGAVRVVGQIKGEVLEYR